MKNLLKIAAVLVFCASFALAQTPATPTTSQSTQVEKPMLEFANANSAKIAWTSKASQDLVLQWGIEFNEWGAKWCEKHLKRLRNEPKAA